MLIVKRCWGLKEYVNIWQLIEKKQKAVFRNNFRFIRYLLIYNDVSLMGYKNGMNELQSSDKNGYNEE